MLHADKIYIAEDPIAPEDVKVSEMSLNRVLHRVGIKRKAFAPSITPKVEVVVAMGPTSTQEWVGCSDIYNFHGTVHRHKSGVWVVPTFRPLDLVGSSKEILTAISDINKAFEVVNDGFTEPTTDFIEYPTAATASAFADDYKHTLANDPNTYLSVDIETPYSGDIDEEEKDDKDSSWNIERISFSFRERGAITMPWVSPFIEVSKRLLNSGGTKIFWNGNKFDVPRLRAAGCSIPGRIIDGMDAFHFLYSDIPKGLGYATPFFTNYKPWKHLSSTNMPYYSCMDAVAALECVSGIKQRLSKDKLWDVFIRDFVNIEPTFQTMSSVGIGIDTSKQQELREHYERLRDGSKSIIQELVPDILKPTRKKGGYSGKPKDVRELVRSGVCEDRAWVDLGYYKQEDGKWNRRDEFNPNSTTQIRGYIASKYGENAIPRNKKTGKETTGNEELERLAKRYNDKVLFTIIDASSAGDKLSSFINNWPIGTDGRVHPTFTNNPATFRLSSVRPNSQNFPHRSEELDKMRQMIIAGDSVDDDWYIVECDYSGIEAIQVGHYANDKNYEKLAKLGVHSFLSAAMLGSPIDLGISDAELKLAIKDAKKRAKNTLAPGTSTAIYDVAKRVIHGSNYGMGRKLMSESYPDCFPTQADAARLQDMYFDLFPLVKEWHNHVINLAYEQCCLINDFGYRRWFWDAKRWAFNKRINDWELVPSGDAKKVISTLPQGSAAAIIRRAMLSESFQQLVEEEKAMIQIHDSLVCRARKNEVDRVVELMLKSMVYPIPEQGGLVIPVEAKVGHNWRSRGKDNPCGMEEIAV
jgi:DNA polymerase I-like protein with 3'-5' exonuclease and polymerase domains